MAGVYGADTVIRAEVCFPEQLPTLLRNDDGSQVFGSVALDEKPRFGTVQGEQEDWPECYIVKLDIGGDPVILTGDELVKIQESAKVAETAVE
jgi:hypothetical protein